jgi:hypothetical protein
MYGQLSSKESLRDLVLTVNAHALAGYNDLCAIPADSTKLVSFGLTKDQITSTDDAYSTGTSGKVCK